MRNFNTLFLGLALILGGWLSGSSQNMTINTFNKETHTGAATIEKDFVFPSDLSGYKDIIMNFNLSCPSGGCDPWDRFANIKIKKDGENYEIGRYITPYGNGNCGWSLDVTQYRSLLTDTVTLVSFIETWSKGWDLTVDFDLIAGTPDYEYSLIENLWVDYHFTYGDTLFYSIDLPEKYITPPSNTERSTMRVVNTGHGQGNYNNAAEFMSAQHKILVNNFPSYFQTLWNTNCASNTCSPQGGNWQPGRAGWCPGMEVTPDDYDLTSLAPPGQTTKVDYELQKYFNRCSPWNPTCNVSSDCMSWVSSCNYNSSDHTEPNYKISVQMIYESSTPLTPVSNEQSEFEQRITVYPNPSKGKVNVRFDLQRSMDVDLKIFDITGKVVYSGKVNQVAKNTSSIDLSKLDGGVYVVQINSGKFSTHKKIILQ